MCQTLWISNTLIWPLLYSSGAKCWTIILSKHFKYILTSCNIHLYVCSLHNYSAGFIRPLDYYKDSSTQFPRRFFFLLNSKFIIDKLSVEEYWKCSYKIKSRTNPVSQWKHLFIDIFLKADTLLIVFWQISQNLMVNYLFVSLFVNSSEM